jgi:Collagen triple helix repeat (20 copies)/Chaperone of endosialidase
MSGNQQLNVTTKSWDIIASRIYSGTQANLTLESSGTANVLVKTNGNVIVTGDPTGNVTFKNTPICSVLPVINPQLVNKAYMDKLFNSGPQGPQGSQGVQGAQGFQGSAGLQGAQGAQGSMGVQGLQGAQGSVGAQGAQGFQGSAGLQGAQGFQGSAGLQGATGAQGATGNQGATGPQGSTGNQGASGSLVSFVTDSNNNLSFTGNGTSSVTINLSATIGSPTPIAGIQSSGNLYFSGLNIYLNAGNPINFKNASGTTYVFKYTNTTDTYTPVTCFAMSDSLKVPLITSSGGVAVYGNPTAASPTSSTLLYYNASSQRYKTNIQTLPDSDSILDIQPVFFNYKDASGNAIGKRRIGFIAEEMAENELGNYFVVRDAEGLPEGINYELTIPLYASALRFLKTKINDLEKTLQDLNDEIETENLFYEQSISELETLLQSQ